MTHLHLILFFVCFFVFYKPLSFTMVHAHATPGPPVATLLRCSMLKESWGSGTKQTHVYKPHCIQSAGISLAYRVSAPVRSPVRARVQTQKQTAGNGGVAAAAPWLRARPACSPTRRQGSCRRLSPASSPSTASSPPHPPTPPQALPRALGSRQCLEAHCRPLALRCLWRLEMHCRVLARGDLRRMDVHC